MFIVRRNEDIIHQDYDIRLYIIYLYEIMIIIIHLDDSTEI